MKANKRAYYVNTEAVKQLRTYHAQLALHALSPAYISFSLPPLAQWAF
jgi:hypothetical protein